ncbi:hypothetical protein AB2L57_05880 [Microbacterium sp. HA-8]|uniref:hypothetical protein n=1 Tax=Microbacterium sp. HA-8 TaxID=3234200 RepID=UPI0038F6F4EA
MSDYGTDIADAPTEPVDTGADVSAPDTADYTDEPVDLTDTPPEPEVPEVEEAPPAEDLSDPTADEYSDPVEAPAEAEEPVDLGEAPETANLAPEEPQDWQEGEVVDLGHDAAPDGPQEAETAEADDLAGADLGEPDVADTTVPDAPTDSAGEDLTTRVDDEPDASEAPTGDLAEAAAEGVEESHETEPEATERESTPDADAQEPDTAEIEPEAANEAVDAETEPTVDELTEVARDEARPTYELRAEYDANVADVLADDTPSHAEPTETQDAPEADAAEVPETSDQTDAPADLGNSPENEALTSALADKGLSLEPVERFDYSDNPILGYRESAPPEDVAYAVNAWNDQVAPGIAAGATREDFAAYDHEHGLEGHQQLAGVYDYMLGDDAIKSGGEREDGSLDVTGGRHRLEQARQNGIQYLPVRK